MANQSAAQRALAIPEVLALIISYVDNDDDFNWNGTYSQGRIRRSRPPNEDVGDKTRYKDSDAFHYGRLGILLRCCLVNRAWYEHTLPYLWRNIDFFDLSWHLPDAFRNMSYSRRQYHANFVQVAPMLNLHMRDSDDCGKVLSRIRFPNLHTLILRLRPMGYGWEHYIPMLLCPNVTNMQIDPPFDGYPERFGISLTTWDSILEDIAGYYPRLVHVEFLDGARIKLETVELFTRRQDKLKDFDRQMLDLVIDPDQEEEEDAPIWW